MNIANICVEAERFWTYVERTDSCWFWRGTITTQGYAHFYFKGRNYRAHRIAYELIKQPIPAGCVLDHLCRVKHCVNPAHLEPVTERENLRRGPLGNTGSGWERGCSHGCLARRHCKVCLAENMRAYRAKQKA